MLTLFRIFAKSRRGTSAMEFALIMPVMLLFIGGIVEIGRAFLVYNALNRLTTRYAVSYADCLDDQASPPATPSCQKEITNLYSQTAAMQNIAPQLTGPLTLRMMQIVGGAATATYYTTGTSPNATEIVQSAAMFGAGNQGVIVNISYTHSLIFFANLMKQFFPQTAGGTSWTFSYTVYQRKN